MRIIVADNLICAKKSPTLIIHACEEGVIRADSVARVEFVLFEQFCADKHALMTKWHTILGIATDTRDLAMCIIDDKYCVAIEGDSSVFLHYETPRSEQNIRQRL